MATSVRLLSKDVDAAGGITCRFSDNTSLVFFSQSDYDKFVGIDQLDADIVPMLKRVLLGWSHANQDAVDRQCIFDALEVNRNIMRIRN